MSSSKRSDAREESARFLETFRACLVELGYKPGMRLSRSDFTTAVFRSSRQFTNPSTNASSSDDDAPAPAEDPDGE